MDEAITRRDFVDNVENLRLIQYLWQALKSKHIPSKHGTFRMSPKGMGQIGYQYELTSEKVEVITSQIFGDKTINSLLLFLVKPTDSKAFTKENEVIPNELQLRWIQKTPFANFVVAKHLLHPLLKHDVRYAKRFIEKYHQEYEKCRQFLLSNKVESVEEVLTEIEGQPDTESVNTDKLISLLTDIFIQDTIAFLQTKGIEIDQTNRVDSSLMDCLEKLLNYKGEDAEAVRQLIELMSSYFVIHQKLFRKEQPVLHNIELKQFVLPHPQRVKIEEESPLYVAEEGSIEYPTKGEVVVPPLKHPIIENISSQPQHAVKIEEESPLYVAEEGSIEYPTKGEVVVPSLDPIIEDISPQPQHAVIIEEDVVNRIKEEPAKETHFPKDNDTVEIPNISRPEKDVVTESFPEKSKKDSDIVAKDEFIPGPKEYPTKGEVAVPSLDPIIEDISSQPQHAVIAEEDTVNLIREEPAKKTRFPEHDDTVEIPNILRPEKDVVTESFPKKGEKYPDIKEQMDNGVVDQNLAYSKLNKEKGGMNIFWGFPCIPFLLLWGIVIPGFEFILIPIAIFLVTLLVNKRFATELEEPGLKYMSLMGGNGKELDGSSVDIHNAVRDRALYFNNGKTLGEDQKITQKILSQEYNELLQSTKKLNGDFASKERQRCEIKHSIRSNKTRAV